MCFNAQVSIVTYTFGQLGCMLLGLLNVLPESIFFSWVLVMQLIEYFLWNHQPCDSFNKLVTKTGILVNHTEPLVLWMSIRRFSKRKLPKQVNELMFAFLVASAVYTYNVMTDECTTVTDFSQGHLYWAWNECIGASFFYMFFLFVMSILCLFGLEHGRTCCIINNASYVLSYAIYRDTHTVGAMWCFSVAIDPWLLILIYNWSRIAKLCLQSSHDRKVKKIVKDSFIS